MISHHDKFIYIHITKTAGVSIEHSLREYYREISADVSAKTQTSHELPGYLEGPQHADLRGILRNRTISDGSRHQQSIHSGVSSPAFSGCDLSHYFTFSFVRNPWDRMVSFYYHHQRNSPERRSLFEKESISFSDFIYSTKSFGLKNTRESGRNPDQLSWLENPSQNLDDIDFIGRFETLQRDFDTVCDRIGTPRMVLGILNQTRHQPYRHYYDKGTYKFVANKYRRDIEYFGYTF